MDEEETDILAKYTFTAEGGGATSAETEKPKIKVLKRGIRLYFMRKGLFYDKNKEDRAKITSWQINDKSLASVGASHNDSDGNFTLADCEIKDNKIPTSENYGIYNTKINAGYIYLINADDPNEYKELLIDDAGLLTNIKWTEANLNANVRLPNKNEKAKKYFYVGKKPKKFYIVFSPVQWSADYHKTIRNSKEKQKELMQLVDCKGIAKGDEDAVADVYTYFNVNSVFKKNDKQIQAHRTTYLNIHHSEKKDEKKGDNDIFEDMFVSLDDPIGMADDIAIQLITEHNKHKALIESIQTGESENIIFDRLEKNESRTKKFSDYETT